MFSEHSQQECLVGLMDVGTDRKKCSMLCCRVIDACTTPKDEGLKSKLF